MEIVNCIIDWVAIILGLYVVIPRLKSLYEFIYKCFIMRQHDLKQRYNSGGSYVLVTGCTSGIGEEMAHRFAKEGFNVVLLSRNLDKLKQVASDIKTKSNPNVEIRIV